VLLLCAFSNVLVGKEPIVSFSVMHTQLVGRKVVCGLGLVLFYQVPGE
jgi:hypothetical protein